MIRDGHLKRLFAVLYGRCIQLKHCASDKFLSLCKGVSGLQPGSIRVEVDTEGGEGSWLDVQPGFKVRKEQEPVVVTDQAVLRFTKKGLFLHSYCPHDVGETGTEIPADFPGNEINGWETRDSRFTVRQHAKFDQGNRILCSGDPVRVMHKQEQVWRGVCV